jgi:hypothetical protein
MPDIETMLDKTRLDGVVIATPNHLLINLIHVIDDLRNLCGDDARRADGGRDRQARRGRMMPMQADAPQGNFARRNMLGLSLVTNQ